METPNTLQEFQMRVSSSGLDKSAFSATKNPGSIDVEELQLRWVLGLVMWRDLAEVSCGVHMGSVS